MEISMNDAYEEACRKLGEQVVLNGLMEAEVERLKAEAPEEWRPTFPPAPVQQFPVGGNVPPSGRTDCP